MIPTICPLQHWTNWGCSSLTRSVSVDSLLTALKFKQATGILEHNWPITLLWKLPIWFCINLTFKIWMVERILLSFLYSQLVWKSCKILNYWIETHKISQLLRSPWTHQTGWAAYLLSVKNYSNVLSILLIKSPICPVCESCQHFLTTLDLIWSKLWLKLGCLHTHKNYFVQFYWKKLWKQKPHKFNMKLIPANFQKLQVIPDIHCVLN